MGYWDEKIKKLDWCNMQCIKLSVVFAVLWILGFFRDLRWVQKYKWLFFILFVIFVIKPMLKALSSNALKTKVKAKLRK